MRLALLLLLSGCATSKPTYDPLVAAAVSLVVGAAIGAATAIAAQPLRRCVP